MSLMVTRSVRSMLTGASSQTVSDTVLLPGGPAYSNGLGSPAPTRVTSG